MVNGTYSLASQWWTEGGTVKIYDVLGTFIAIIPMEFMITSNSDSWLYVKSVVEHCVTDDGYLKTADGNPIVEDSAVTAGTYTFVKTDDPTAACTFRRGPESKRQGRPPGDGETEVSTQSNSARSTQSQTTFRQYLLARDRTCLLTGRHWSGCIASHIVPYSRKDLYPQILEGPVTNFFHPSMGLLLRNDLHSNFDVYDWSLLPLENEYVVHVFKMVDAQTRALHGKRISYDLFRDRPSEKPDAKLLLWHYRQCVQMRFRGFSHRISPQDTLADGQQS